MANNQFEEILNKINEIKDDLKKDFGGKSFSSMKIGPTGEKTAVYGKESPKTLADHVNHMDAVNPKRHPMPDALPPTVEQHLKTKGKNLKFGSPDHLDILRFINTHSTKYPEYANHVNNALINKTMSVLEKLGAIEELIKSNYGPKGAGLYDAAANQERKAKNVDKVPSLGPNQNVKTYTSAPQGTATAQADKEAKEAKKKSKKMPVKVGTPEEIAAMNAKMSAEAAKPIKGIDDVKKTLPPGYIQLQPTDTELFGSLVKSQEEVNAVEQEWNDRINSLSKACQAKVEAPHEKTNAAWQNGKSFNDQLTDEEKKERNSYVGE